MCYTDMIEAEERRLATAAAKREDKDRLDS